MDVYNLVTCSCRSLTLERCLSDLFPHVSASKLNRSAHWRLIYLLLALTRPEVCRVKAKVNGSLQADMPSILSSRGGPRITSGINLAQCIVGESVVASGAFHICK